MSTSLTEMIRKQEEQLAELRQRYQEKQERLISLQAKCESLLAQLSQLDHDISILAAELGISMPPGPTPASPSAVPTATATVPATASATLSNHGSTASVTPRASEEIVQPPLRHFIIEVLKQSNTPLSAKAIAERVIAMGYHTRSQHFANIVQNTIRAIDDYNIQFTPRVGYLLVDE